MTPRRKRSRRVLNGFRPLSRLLLTAALLAAVGAWTCLPAAAQSTEPHRSWTESEATHTITAGEASALTGVPADRLSVLWSVDYSAEEYPTVARISAPGLDGLTVYVFEYLGGDWTLLTTGTGPLVDAPVNEGGSLCAVATAVGANYPAKDTTRKAPDMGSASWLLSTAAVTALGIACALFATRKKAV